MLHLRKIYVWSFGGCVICADMASAAINVDAFSTLTNDRFSNDAQFIANAYDLSGVAIADNGRWVTMLSENVFLSAEHYAPSNGTEVTFYSGNDPNGASVTRTIQSSQRIGSSDLRIGTLDAALGEGYAFYDFATLDLTNFYVSQTGPSSFLVNDESFLGSQYWGADAYLFGRSPSAFATSQDMAIGRNKLDRWYDSVTAAGTTDDAMASVTNTSGDANYLTYEAQLQVGDSGAPMMVDSGSGELTIVGINWFIANDGSNDLSGYSYVGNYDEQIQAFIDANPVPEARLFGAVLGLCAWGLVGGRRQRRA